MNEEEIFEEVLQQEFLQAKKIYRNLEQVVIVTTEDKLRLCLYKAIDNLDAKREWLTPVALLVTLVLTLTTAEFKDQFTIPAATWEAFFLLLTVASFIWTGVALWKASKVKVSVESIVSEIKQQSPEITDVEAGQRD